MLARQLLDDAIIQAENSLAPVSVTACLHIARVLTAYSKEEARTVLLRALRDLKNLALRDQDLQVLRGEARVLTAATAPDLIAEVPPVSEWVMHHSEFRLFRTMLDHGHLDAAFERLLKFEPAAEFPHNGAVKECWPSTNAFRSLLYAAGKSIGSEGAIYLEKIPDPALRLYCQIEFVAALAGLPEYSGTRVSSPRLPDPAPTNK